MSANKLSNRYVEMVSPAFYASTPKAVWAAIAMSSAINFDNWGPSDLEAAMREEWRILYQNGIVPQGPPR